MFLNPHPVDYLAVGLNVPLTITMTMVKGAMGMNNGILHVLKISAPTSLSRSMVSPKIMSVS